MRAKGPVLGNVPGSHLDDRWWNATESAEFLKVSVKVVEMSGIEADGVGGRNRRSGEEREVMLLYIFRNIERVPELPLF